MLALTRGAPRPHRVRYSILWPIARAEAELQPLDTIIYYIVYRATYLQHREYSGYRRDDVGVARAEAGVHLGQVGGPDSFSLTPSSGGPDSFSLTSSIPSGRLVALAHSLPLPHLAALIHSLTSFLAAMIHSLSLRNFLFFTGLVADSFSLPFFSLGWRP